jgi:pyrroline-5-carboxylate reductase
MKMLVLGAGKMTESLLLGLHGEVDMSSWGIYSPTGTRAQNLASKVGATFIVHPHDFQDPDCLLIGCKPQQLKELKAQIGDRFKDVQVVSMLAALSENSQRQILGAQKLVRIMPNLPVRVKAGVILMSSESSPAELSKFSALFSSLGTVKVVKEDELEELTLLTGSGPAFFFEFAIELSRLARSLSLAEREALARKVLEGAGLMMTQDQEPLSTHVNNVTSKGGVTIAVLEKWREVQWGEILKKGFERGVQRIEEIREMLKK